MSHEDTGNFFGGVGFDCIHLYELGRVLGNDNRSDMSPAIFFQRDDITANRLARRVGLERPDVFRKASVGRIARLLAHRAVAYVLANHCNRDGMSLPMEVR